MTPTRFAALSPSDLLIASPGKSSPLTQTLNGPKLFPLISRTRSTQPPAFLILKNSSAWFGFWSIVSGIGFKTRVTGQVLQYLLRGAGSMKDIPVRVPKMARESPRLAVWIESSCRSSTAAVEPESSISVDREKRLLSHSSSIDMRVSLGEWRKELVFVRKYSEMKELEWPETCSPLGPWPSKMPIRSMLSLYVYENESWHGLGSPVVTRPGRTQAEILAGRARKTVEFCWVEGLGSSIFTFE